jgi:ABC-type sulfate transport system permease subunit
VHGDIVGLDIVVVVVVLVALPLMLLVVPTWRIYVKAGEPGWASIVPLFSQYTLCSVVGRPVWWLIFLLIPYVNFVFWLIVAMDLARVFSRSKAFGIGLWLLPFVFLPILGYGSAEYTAPTGVSAA